MGPRFPPTRGSSDSIAPRNSLPTGSQKMKGSLFHFSQSIHAAGKSSVRVVPPLIRMIRPSTRSCRTDGRSRVKDRRAIIWSQKSRSFMQKTHSNHPHFCVRTQIPSIHSLVHSPMVIPCYMDTREKKIYIKTQESEKERRQKISADRKCFLHAQTKNSIYFS